MTGPLLKSAPLTHYHAVGAVGNPVYLAAAQLRAAISRRLGPEVADVFAVPQRSEDGATVDWYAPKTGTVVPWNSATEAERADAQQRLIEVREQIETLGRSMEAEASPERQVFGRLLAQVMQFPDEQDVHLVDGSPVLSFWGFSRDRATVGSDPLHDLARHIASPEPGPAARPRRPWWLWLLLAMLALLLLAALLWALRGCENIEDGGRETPATPTGTDERRLMGGVSEPEASPPEETVVAEEADTLTQTLPEPDPAAADRIETQRRLFDGTDRTTVVNRYGERIAVDGDIGDVIAPGDEPLSTSDESDLIESDLIDSDVADPVADGDAVIDTADATTAGDAEETVDEPVDEAVAEPMLPDADGVAVGRDETATASEPDAAEDTSSAEAPPDGDGSSDNAEADGEADAIATDADASSAAADAPADADQPRDGSSATATDEDGTAAAAPGDEGEAERTEGSASAATPNADAMAADAAAAARAAAARSAPVRIPAQELLNSGWRTSTTLQDPKDGSPVRLDYRLRDGAGKVRLTRKDGSICETDAQGAVRDGRLVVDSRKAIICADGTSFGKPQIDCSPQQGGKARCVGRYADGSSFPIDMERQAD